MTSSVSRRSLLSLLQIGLELLSLRLAAEAWTKLKNLYDAQAYAQQQFLDLQWRDISKGTWSMSNDLNGVTKLASQFVMVGRPNSAAEINEQVLSDFGADRRKWPTTKALSNLLLNEEPNRYENHLHYMSQEKSQQLWD